MRDKEVEKLMSRSVKHMTHKELAYYAEEGILVQMMLMQGLTVEEVALIMSKAIVKVMNRE